MPLIYVTGMPGTGKTAVRDELLRRGYTTYDTDEDGLAQYYNTETNESVGRHMPAKERTPEWRKTHEWKVQRSSVERLRAEATDKPVFLCGVVANDADEFWDLFDTVFALTLDEATLKHRITTRTTGDYGKNEHEFASLLGWHKTADDDYRKLEAILVDASQTLERVVDEILEKVEKPSHDYDKLSRNSLALFVKKLNQVTLETPYDLVLAGGDSGNIMAWITNAVYEHLQIARPPIVTLPIYRHADYAETILFDNKILSTQIPPNKDALKNILVVDDEVGVGNTIKGLLDALSETTSEKPNVTFIAEDDGFDASKIIGWDIDFRPPQPKVKDVYNAVSYIIPQEYELPIRVILEPIVEDTNDKHIMATLLNLPIKEYNDGNPEFTFKYRDECLKQIDNFKTLQKGFQDFIRAEIGKSL